MDKEHEGHGFKQYLEYCRHAGIHYFAVPKSNGQRANEYWRGGARMGWGGAAHNPRLALTMAAPVFKFTVMAFTCGNGVNSATTQASTPSRH
jgi:hypothetical protein